MAEILSYKNLSIGLPWKSMDWFLYHRDLHHEKFNQASKFIKNVNDHNFHLNKLSFL